MWMDEKNRELLHQILGVGLEVDLVLRGAPIALMRRCSKWYQGYIVYPF